MKKKTHFFWWLLSPTYKHAEKKKLLLLNTKTRTSTLSTALKSYNKRYLTSSTAICLAAAILMPLLSYLNPDGIYNHPKLKYVMYAATAFISWIFIASRTVEIFKAFLDDAIEKLNNTPSSSDLKYGERLKLSFNSYIELIINFATLCYILPPSAFKDQHQFSSIFEAIYFSGVTITTVGYGDITPTLTILQLFSLLQVITGFALIVVCFGVYSNLALNKQNNSPKAEPPK
jgi:voltage-gated potassium channel